MGKAGMLIAACMLGACLQPSLETCKDGRVCPPGLVCDDGHDLCVLDEQLHSCGADPDGTPCDIGGAPGGFCQDGVCLRARCQDGIVAPSEDCEPSVALALDCTDLGYYETGALGCTDDCLFDVTACTGGYCGDGHVDAPEDCDAAPGVVVAQCQELEFYDPGDVTCTTYCRYQLAACTGFCGDLTPNGEEACDGAPPDDACIDYGFDYGALACSDFCTPGFAACGAIGWHRFAGLSRDFRAVWSWGDGSFALAGGAAGALAAWDGAAWQSQTSPLTGQVYGIWGPSPDVAFAVTVAGEIARWNGAAWTLETEPAEEPLLAVSGTSATDVWAIGGHRVLNYFYGILLHRDASGWTRIDDGSLSAVADVAAIAPDDVWAVGLVGALHWDGGAWTPVDELAGTAYTSVWASGPDDVYVAGLYGDLRHFDGTSWRIVPLATAQHFVDIAGSSPSDLYVTGQDGGGYHFDGRTWFPSDLPPSSALWVGSGAAFAASTEMWQRSPSGFEPDEVREPADLGALGGTGATDAFAGGESGTILHFDGFLWRATRSACAGTIGGIWRHVAACERGGLAEWNGSEWVAIDTGVSAGFSDVWGTGPSDLWAVGDRVMHYDGASWTERAPPSGANWSDVDGCGTDDVYLLGAAGDVMHWDGAAWTPIALPGDHRDVWCRAPDDVWIVGDLGLVLRWDGATWSSVPSLPYDYTGVSGSAADAVYLVSPTATMRWDGTQLQGAGGGATAVWVTGSTLFQAGVDLQARSSQPGASGPEVTVVPQVNRWLILAPDDIFTAGGNWILHFDGTIWSSLGGPGGLDIWGTADDDLHVAALDGGVDHWDGATWTHLAGPLLWAIDGRSATDAWAVGDTVLHLDAAGWSTVPAATTGTLRDVIALPTGEAFAVGNEVLFWNGTAWTQVASAPHVLRAVWAAAADDVFAVGDQGTILHGDGAGWTAQDAPVTTDLFAVWGTSGSDVFAAGAGGRLLHYDGSRWSPVRVDRTDPLVGLGGDGDTLYIGTETTSLRLFRYQPW